ncbi:hypothetical protein DLM78_23295 [Leptospira stimsonii]|uniref:Uncharacterized protein n=1 Tax=Leptospira stimsonii TaxID=2202203 RepID=A0A8B3CH87_9LEPT|nr:hypothetical protein DLM78_23295 [Leptospira stimsonii]
MFFWGILNFRSEKRRCLSFDFYLKRRMVPNGYSLGIRSSWKRGSQDLAEFLNSSSLVLGI